MIRKLFIFSFSAMLSMVSLAKVGASTPKGFTDNYELALNEAQKDHKLIFAVFSGSDWCGWCMKLEREVLSQSEFVKKVKPNFVLLFVDRPKNQELLSKQAKVENPKLVKKYGIGGYPSVLILSEQGEVLKRMGYQPGGAKAYAELVNSVRDGLAIKALSKDDPERIKKLDAFLKDKGTMFQVRNRLLVNEILEADKDGKLGYRKNYAFFTDVEPVDNHISEVLANLNEECGKIKANYPGDEEAANKEIMAKLYPKTREELKAMHSKLKSAKVPKHVEGDKQKVLSALDDLIKKFGNG